MFYAFFTHCGFWFLKSLYVSLIDFFIIFPDSFYYWKKTDNVQKIMCPYEDKRMMRLPKLCDFDDLEANSNFSTYKRLRSFIRSWDYWSW
jgi:hypothetical protein